MKKLRLILIALILSVSAVSSEGQTAPHSPASPSAKPLAITPTPRTENPGWMKIVERQAVTA